MIYFLWVTPQTPHHCLLIQTHNTAETVSLFMPLDVTADLQSHCSVLSPVILSSFLSWTRASKRCMDKFPLVCEPLVPPLLVAPHLMFCHLHLWVCSGKDPCTHTHTHTDMQHKHTHVRDRDTNANREHVAVHKEPLVHTQYRDFHISYRKIYILIFKCELYQSPNSMKEH